MVIRPRHGGLGLGCGPLMVRLTHNTVVMCAPVLVISQHFLLHEKHWIISRFGLGFR